MYACLSVTVCYSVLQWVNFKSAGTLMSNAYRRRTCVISAGWHTFPLPACLLLSDMCICFFSICKIIIPQRLSANDNKGLTTLSSILLNNPHRSLSTNETKG